jgi:hypothetical protein
MHRYKVSRHDDCPDTLIVDAWSTVEAKLKARKLWAAQGKPAPLGIKITAARKHTSTDGPDIGPPAATT